MGRPAAAATAVLALAFPVTAFSYSRLDALAHLKASLKGAELTFALKMFQNAPYSDAGMNMEFAQAAARVHFMSKGKRQQAQAAFLLLGKASAADMCVSQAGAADEKKAKAAGLSLRQACEAVVRGALAG